MNFRKTHYFIVFCLLVLGLFLGGCASETSPTETITPAATPMDNTVTPAPTIEPSPMATATNALFTSEAAVDDIQVSLLSTSPVEVQVTASGHYPDGCTETAEIVQDRNENIFMITVVTQRPTDAVCTEALVPFTETFMLQNVTNLAENVYTVQANGATAQFELELSSLPNTDSELMAAVSPAAGTPDSTVTVTASGFPANTTVDIGFGPVESEYAVIASGQTDDAGHLNTTVTVPETAASGEWAFVVRAAGQDAVSNVFTVTTSSASNNGDDQQDRVNIYLIALEDAGQSGELIGCDDSVVPVEIVIDETITPLTAALNQMFAQTEAYYGQSGLFNVFHNSNIFVRGIDIDNGQATINISGDLSVGGVCDAPRIEAQIRQTALQFSTVDSVVLQYEGQPLDEFLDARG